MAVKSSEAEGKDNSNSNSNGRGYSSSRAQPSMPSIFASTSFTHTSNGTASSRPMMPHSHPNRSEEHTSELQSLMRTSYAVFCLKKKQTHIKTRQHQTNATQTS